MKYGILVASDQKEEWLLPWWWAAYSKHNNFPVTFFDWGMSQEARQWCKERGTLVSQDIPSSLLSNASLAPHIERALETLNAQFLVDIRPYWFSKPTAMKNIDYEQSLWIDLDCEILGPLDPLFDYLNCPAGLAVARDTELSSIHNYELGILDKKEVLYNSGVVAFKKGSPLIEDWSDLCLKRHSEFFGDQNILSYLVHEKNYKIRELPETYNWRVSQGLHFSARIIHWAGSWGKEFIKKHGGLTPFLFK